MNAFPFFIFYRNETIPHFIIQRGFRQQDTYTDFDM